MDVFEIGDAIERARAQRAEEERLAGYRRRVEDAQAEYERLAKIADRAIAAERAAWKRLQACRDELTHATAESLMPTVPRTQQ